MDRRQALALIPGLGAGVALAQPGQKTLRYAFSSAETGFDPAKVFDLYSRVINAHVFEAPYCWDHLARPYKLKPLTAAALPEVSSDFRTWTIRLRRGVFFADDPAFGGRPRELVAADYVYAWKRHFDPDNNSPSYASYAQEGMLGLEALRRRAVQTRQPFDYDTEVEGLRTLDRYTLQFRLGQPRPRFAFTLADSGLIGAVAREVIEHYGERSMEHPVGTGPFRLVSWRRSSSIVLERNPAFRELRYDAEPNADDAEGQALLRRFAGRRLPMIDRVEIAIIEEGQPRWLSFLNGQFDLAWPVPTEFGHLAAPNGHLAPHLARRGMRLHRVVNSDVVLFYFNMDDPVVGGNAPEKVALRRAISLSYDINAEIALVRRGQAIAAQGPAAPGAFGYDPAYKSENSDFDPARAKALLDLYGWVDRDGDGWREQPDGAPLQIEYATVPDQIYRQFDEQVKRAFDAIGIRVRFRSAKWPEQLKAARAGKLQMWSLGYTMPSPNVHETMQLLYGPAAGGQNLARFNLPRYDALYERTEALPDDAERLGLLREMFRLTTAYAPHKYLVHRIMNDLTQPWVFGYRRPLYGNRFWQYIDIDEHERHRSTA
jgi:ABC-type transport system substrate-binding protein